MRDDGIVEFREMQFPNGTRLKVVRLKFQVKIDYRQAGQIKSTEIESETTEPFIVITNENQYGECYGHLLKMTIFKSVEHLSWQVSNNFPFFDFYFFAILIILGSKSSLPTNCTWFIFSAQGSRY